MYKRYLKAFGKYRSLGQLGFGCLVLFLIGATLTYSSLKNVGIKPLVLVVVAWPLISITSIVYVKGFIKY